MLMEHPIAVLKFSRFKTLRNVMENLQEHT